MYQHLIWMHRRRGVAVVEIWAGNNVPARDVWISRTLRGHASGLQVGGRQGSLCRRRKWQHQLTCAVFGDIGLYQRHRWTEAIRTNLSKYAIASTCCTSTSITDSDVMKGVILSFSSSAIPSTLLESCRLQPVRASLEWGAYVACRRGERA